MNRGEIWTVSGGPGNAGQPRPALIVQADDYRDTASVAVCLITTDKTEAPGLREPIQPTQANGLRQPSQIMVDKIMALSRNRLGQRVGVLSSNDLARVERALLVFLGLAG